MDNREVDSQHHSFPKILDQLSSDEIMLLYYVSIGKLNITFGILPAQIQNHNRKFHKQKRELCSYFQFESEFQFYEEHLENLNLIIVAKNSYGLLLTSFGEKFLKACLNEKSE